MPSLPNYCAPAAVAPDPSSSPALQLLYPGDRGVRSRSVGLRVLSDALALPALPASLLADWHRDIAQQLALEPGDVACLSLPRARRRWAQYGSYVAAVEHWLQGLGLPVRLARNPPALMACRGAPYHHDGMQYAGLAFCNLFLGQDRGLDVHLPAADVRLPLAHGRLLLFDPSQPHAVVARGSSGFVAADFADVRTSSQVFLSWELPLEEGPLASALGVAFANVPAQSAELQAPQLRVQGVVRGLCPHKGLWLAA